MSTKPKNSVHLVAIIGSLAICPLNGCSSRSAGPANQERVGTAGAD